jgi:hypothetical protein
MIENIDNTKDSEENIVHLGSNCSEKVIWERDFDILYPELSDIVSNVLLSFKLLLPQLLVFETGMMNTSKGIKNFQMPSLLRSFIPHMTNTKNVLW